MSLVLHLAGACDRDLSRYKHTLTKSGVITGDGMEFASARYMDCGNNAAFDITDYLTIVAWVYLDPAVIGANLAEVVCKGNFSSATKGYDFGFDNRSGESHFEFQVANTGVVIQKYSAAVIKGWHQVGGVFNKDLAGSDKSTIYVDGVENEAGSVIVGSLATIGTNAVPIRCGISSAGTYPLTGKENNVRVYDNPWSASDFADHYERTRLWRH